MDGYVTLTQVATDSRGVPKRLIWDGRAQDVDRIVTMDNKAVITGIYYTVELQDGTQLELYHEVLPNRWLILSAQEGALPHSCFQYPFCLNHTEPGA